MEFVATVRGWGSGVYLLVWNIGHVRIFSLNGFWKVGDCCFEEIDSIHFDLDSFQFLGVVYFVVCEYPLVDRDYDQSADCQGFDKLPMLNGKNSNVLQDVQVSSSRPVKLDLGGSALQYSPGARERYLFVPFRWGHMNKVRHGNHHELTFFSLFGNEEFRWVKLDTAHLPLGPEWETHHLLRWIARQGTLAPGVSPQLKVFLVVLKAEDLVHFDVSWLSPVDSVRRAPGCSLSLQQKPSQMAHRNPNFYLKLSRVRKAWNYGTSLVVYSVERVR